jgi:hypothetical protein
MPGSANCLIIHQFYHTCYPFCCWLVSLLVVMQINRAIAVYREFEDRNFYGNVSVDLLRKP